MRLTPEHRAELLASTKGAAAALVDDLQYIRTVVQNHHPSNGDIRRLSVLLRRILIEGDLAAISAPRLGRVKLVGPDNNSAYRIERKRPFLFFMSGRAKILGGWSGTLCLYDVKKPRFGERIDFPNIDVDGTVDMTLDTFRSQRVLCYRGKWVSREAVIKYVAIVGHGAHSAAPKPGDHTTLSYIRNSAFLRLEGEGIHLDFFPNGIDTDDATFRHEPDAIDPVLIELLAAATFLVRSPFISELDEAIRSELNAQRHPA